MIEIIKTILGLIAALFLILIVFSAPILMIALILWILFTFWPPLLILTGLGILIWEIKATRGDK